MSTQQSLAGLTVLEFSHTIMGPCAGLLLADLGADVIKIEPAPEGDHTRRLPGFAAGFFAAFNRNKRSVAINLKTDEGRAVLHRLVTSADIVVENYGPGTMERLGCGEAVLRDLNPRLIYLALKGFLSGPWQDRPALDEVVQFQSGLAYMTGPPGQPLRAGASVVDILGAVFGVTGVLAALREREQTGSGQRVGSALFESAAFLMASHMAAAATTGQQVPPMTARRGAWGIYDPFTFQHDEQLFIGVTSDPQWMRFCRVFDFQDLAADTRLDTNSSRSEHRDWLIPELQSRLQPLSLEHAQSLCEQADISWASVARPEDLFTNPQLLDTGGLLEVALATAAGSQADSVRLPALPLEFGATRSRTTLDRQPPAAGEHTLEILTEAGLSHDEIVALVNAAAVRVHESTPPPSQTS
ncbi:MAG: CoA transferase [Gammaproteobacteria bacterium]|nr:CoA transferase [Gammaproteobacteria bacterium]